MPNVSLPSLQAIITRTYHVGLRLEGRTREERRQNEQQANQIIHDLQQTAAQKLTPERVDQAIELIRTHPHWKQTKGAARLADAFADRSNLGQSAYLTLLNAVKGVVDREQKVQTFLDLLQQEPTAQLEWLLFGRTPYLERRLSASLRLKYDYCRNLILSARRTLDTFLPPDQQLTAPLPALTPAACLQGLERYYQQTTASLAKTDALTPQQKQLQIKLQQIYTHRDYLAEVMSEAIAEWNHPDQTTPRSRWTLFKHLSQTVHSTLSSSTKPSRRASYAYFALLRGILVSALGSDPSSEPTVKKLQETPQLRVSHLVPKPFRQTTRKNSRLLPLALVMGSEYVVGRPGNASLMTDLLKENKEFPLQIWRPYQKTHVLQATLRIHSKLQEFLANGAKLKLLVIRSGLPPAEKLQVSLVLEGAYWMFLSRTAVEQQVVPFLRVQPPIPALGLDINRPGIHMLTFSEPFLMSAQLLKLCERYNRLEQVISELGKAVTRAEQWVYLYPSVFSLRRRTKLRGELHRVQTRRARLRKAYHQEASRFLTSVLLQTYCSLLCVEELSLSARGARGALAKATLSMPDEPELVVAAVLLASYIAARPITLRQVNPAYTSQGPHSTCPVSPPGHPVRQMGHWDVAMCPACHQSVNLHREAACQIRDLGVAEGPFPIYLLPHRSLSALPAAPSLL